MIGFLLFVYGLFQALWLFKLVITTMYTCTRTSYRTQALIKSLTPTRTTRPRYRQDHVECHARKCDRQDI